MTQAPSGRQEIRTWPRAHLKDVVIFRSGYRNSDTAVADGEFPFFVCSSEVLRSNEFDFDNEAVIMAGNNADGVFHLHHFDGKFAARQRTYVITPSTKRLDCRYLFYQLGVLQRSFQAAAIGTTTRYVTIEMLREAEIPLPELAVQRAIAEALRDADGLIESLEQLLVKKRQLKQGAMQTLLSGKRRLPGFSGEWRVKPLGDLFNFSGGFTASRDQLSSEGYCYLHYGDIHTSKKSFVDVRSEYQDIPKLHILLTKVSSVSLLEDGDVVFVDASEDDEGTSKHVVIVNRDAIPFISGLHTIVAKSKTDELEHQYRRYCFQTRTAKTQFRFFAVGTKVSGISKINIAKVTLPVPSVPEQTAIANILSDLDAEITALETKLAKSRHLKQGMMQDLLTGRIRLV